jgi:hypothetical protein
MNSNRFFENGVALAMFALLAAFLCSHAKADDTNPNAPTPVTEWVYQGAAFADMLTTLDIKNHPAHCSPAMSNIYGTGQPSVCSGGLVEENPLIGQHPSDGKVLGYFAATGVLHYLVTRELVRENVPAPIVQTWEALGIGLEVGMVAHNYQIGLRARF